MAKTTMTDAVTQHAAACARGQELRAAVPGLTKQAQDAERALDGGAAALKDAEIEHAGRRTLDTERTLALKRAARDDAEETWRRALFAQREAERELELVDEAAARLVSAERQQRIAEFRRRYEDQLARAVLALETVPEELAALDAITKEAEGAFPAHWPGLRQGIQRPYPVAAGLPTMGARLLGSVEGWLKDAALWLRKETSDAA